MVRSAMTIEDEESIGNPDGPVMRPRNFNEMSKSDIYAMLALLGMARAIDKDILGDAQAAYERYQEQQGSEGPVINVLGPEALTEMGIKIGKLVKHLARVTEDRRADKALAESAREQAEPEFESADDPNLCWEEIPDDE